MAKPHYACERMRFRRSTIQAPIVAGEQNMKRERRWTWRVVQGLGIAVLIVMGLWLVLGPTIIERVIATQIEGLGLPKPTLRVGGNSLAHLEILHLSVGQDDRLSIGSLGVDYSIWQLLRKRIDSIEIIGLEAEIRRKDGVWDLGPLAGLHGPIGSDTPTEMPFRRITMRSSTLALDLDGRRLRIPISGSVKNAGPEALALDLTAIIEGVSLQLTGTLNTRNQDFTFTLAGDVPDLGRVLTALAPSITAVAGQPWGGLTAKVAIEYNQGVLSLDATAQGAGWQLSKVKISQTGLEDWLRGKTDLARVQIHAEAGVSQPGLLIQKTSLASWIDGRAISKGEFLADGILELRRTRSDSERSWTWSVNVPTARATLASSDLTIPASGTSLNGVSANLWMTATAETGSLRVNLLPDSWIAIASAEIPASDRTVAGNFAKFVVKECENQPLLTVTLEDRQPATAVTAFVAEAATPITISAGEGTTAELAAVSSTFKGTWSDTGGSLVGSLQISGMNASLRHKFGDRLLDAGIRDASLLVTLRQGFPAGRKPEAPCMIEFVASTPPGAPGVLATVAGVEVATGTIEARGTAALADGVPSAVSARVSLANTSVQHKEMRLALIGLEADVPLTWNAATPPEPGRLAVKSIELQGVALPSLSGTLSVADTRADFAMAWEPLPGAKFRVEGSAAPGIGSRGPSARAYVSIPLFEITDENALGRLVPPLKGLLATGSFALDGYVRLSPDGLVPNIALTILDGGFKSKDWDAQAEGVFGTVRINNISPLLTPRKEFQVALVRHATMGKLEVNDGFVAFRLEPKEIDGRPTGWMAYVQRGECGWVGGRLYTENFRFDPEAKEHTATIFARDLKLADLLALIPDQRATGVGSLNGQLPVTIAGWPNIHFGDGELRTAPGQSGWFKVKDTEVLGSVLDSTDPRFRTDNIYMEIKKRLVNAFKNFEYDELSVVLTKDDSGKFVARVNTKGQARTGEGQKFESVTLNFFDFDKILRDVILISREVQTPK
jgi:hypothetical protein